MSADRKVIIVPEKYSGRSLKRLQLPHPRTGAPCSYYADMESESLLEVVGVDMNGKRSWMGNGWVRSDGSLSMLTPVDPLFIYLSMITNMSVSGEETKFVDVDSISLESQMDAQSISALMSMSTLKQRALDVLCEARQISDNVCVVKIDQGKVLSWLKRKCSVERFPAALNGCVEGIADEELREQTKAREMVLLVSEYLQPFWTDKLISEFGGFAQVCENEKKATKANSAIAFDSPESYTPGVADPKTKPASVKQEHR
ncbi:hypothetical protein H4R23_004298 [Coemansia sp. Cherry 401B]|nr:hypothetical protein IWW54_005135 [Coemansia sp. RSA 2705]KAJ2313102.1 hypothetical protein IWW52_004661 [Coemansia sp. RSA 2704]KAJ2724015.1 hypothetical protein H4R23_004298 [Coemansia sp. Cherry 401B]